MESVTAISFAAGTLSDLNLIFSRNIIGNPFGAFKQEQPCHHKLVSVQFQGKKIAATRAGGRGTGCIASWSGCFYFCSR
jgi:hypothetical protein